MSVENLVLVHCLTTDYEMDGAPTARHSLPSLAMASRTVHRRSVVCSALHWAIGTALPGWVPAPSLETTKRGGQKPSQRETLCKQLCVETKCGVSFLLKCEIAPSAKRGCGRARVGAQEEVDGKVGSGWGWALDEGAEETMRAEVRHMRDRQELKAVCSVRSRLCWGSVGKHWRLWAWRTVIRLLKRPLRMLGEKLQICILCEREKNA